MNKPLVYGLVALAVALAGCQSVVPAFGRITPDYSELPADALRQVALEIEQAVKRGDQDFAPDDRDGIVLSTPTVRQAIRTRAARIQLTDEILNAGHAWERRNGHLYILRDRDYKRATTRRVRDRNAMMVTGEWDDRWALYEGILKAGKFSPRSLSAIQRIFHEARLQVMDSGQKYEDASGKVAVK